MRPTRRLADRPREISMGERDGETVWKTRAALNRHEQTRQCGIPVISVLTGPVALGVQAVRWWVETLERPLALIRLEQPDPASVIVARWHN